MHSPLSTQDVAQRSASAGPSPSLTRSSTPDTTACGSAPVRPAASVIGHAVKQAPHLVQALTISSTRDDSASSKVVAGMAGSVADFCGFASGAFEPGAIKVFRYLPPISQKPRLLCF